MGKFGCQGKTRQTGRCLFVGTCLNLLVLVCTCWCFFYVLVLVGACLYLLVLLDARQEDTWENLVAGEKLMQTVFFVLFSSFLYLLGFFVLVGSFSYLLVLLCTYWCFSVFDSTWQEYTWENLVAKERRRQTG